MMNSLLEWQDKLTSILLEAENKVSSTDVNAAIENQYRVVIDYDDETDKAARGPRLIEPYVYGLSKAGNEVIRAFQYHGSTRRGIPKFKLFRLDRIVNWTPKENSHFYAEPKKLAIAAPGYNNDGDNSLTMIFSQVHFGKQQNKVNEPQSQEWQSPLDKVRNKNKEQQQNIDAQLQTKTNQIQRGATNTKSLRDYLDDEDTDTLQNDIDKALSISDVSQDQYDRDSRSAEEKRDDDVNRKREKRWQQAIDSRPLWRKGAANQELEEFE